jgi:hypothetical protein
MGIYAYCKSEMLPRQAAFNLLFLYFWFLEILLCRSIKAKTLLKMN